MANPWVRFPQVRTRFSPFFSIFSKQGCLFEYMAAQVTTLANVGCSWTSPTSQLAGGSCGRAALSSLVENVRRRSFDSGEDGFGGTQSP